MSKLRVLDLFSGIGGFSLGLERSGFFKTEAFCEIEKYPRMVLRKHWPDAKIYDDVRDISAERLFSDGIRPDVVCGGFPCQDISIASKTKTGIEGERSGLWQYFFKAIRDLRPRFAIIENVFALRTRGLDRVLFDLASIRYDATWTLFDSQFFGVAQRRRRIYILAVRDGIPDGSDVFDNMGRSRPELRREIQDFKERRKRDLAPSSGVWKGAAFFTRQRSDEFSETGLSSTIAKRDHKSFTDLVVTPTSIIRRVSPCERLALQGFPPDWFDGLDIPLHERFRMNGMTTNVVEHIGRRIHESFSI